MRKKMHFKRHLYISDPDAFLREDYDWCFRIRNDDYASWASNTVIDTGQIEFDIDFDEGELIAKVVNAIDLQLDKEQEEFAARIDILNARKQDLLALAPPKESSDSPDSGPASEES